MRSGHGRRHVGVAPAVGLGRRLACLGGRGGVGGRQRRVALQVIADERIAQHALGAA